MKYVEYNLNQYEMLLLLSAIRKISKTELFFTNEELARDLDKLTLKIEDAVRITIGKEAE